MRVGLVTFAEIFIVLSVVFLIEFVLTAALNNPDQGRADSEIYSIRVTTPNNQLRNYLKYLSVNNRTLVWFNSGCKPTLGKSNKLQPKIIASVFDTEKKSCSVTNIAAAGLIHQADELQDVKSFNRYIDRELKVSVSTLERFSSINDWSSNDSPGALITYQAKELDKPYIVTLGVCGEVYDEVDTATDVHQIQIEMTQISNEQQEAYTVSYDLEEKRAFAKKKSRTGNSALPLSLGFKSNDCSVVDSIDSKRNSLALVSIKLERSGPKLVGTKL